MLSAKQIKKLSQLKDAIYAVEPYTLDFEKNLIRPYSCGKEVLEYIDWMYHNNLVVKNCSEIEEEYSRNYDNDDWYKMISEDRVIQALAFCIRRDRFVDGFLAGTIKNKSFEKLVDRLIELHGRK